MKNASPGSNPGKSALPAKLRELLNAPDPDFAAALGAQAVERARAFLAGVKAYRLHPARRDVPEAPVVWREGTTCLRDYNPSSPAAPVVLVVPSLINRFDILDLDGARSFLRSLAASGLRPLVVDWDEPGESERRFSLDDYVARLAAIAGWLCGDASARGKSGGPDLEPRASSFHLLGYCMGGLLALALASLRPASIATLTLMATPWDFHRPDPAVARSLAGLAGQWDDAAAAADLMPVDSIQYLFAFLQPFQSMKKFADFAAMDQTGMAARRFVLLEDWLNNGAPLPPAVARQCLRSWYGENATARLQWTVSGQIVDPRLLTMPSYVVVPGRDRIVPPESALPLARLLPQATLHEPMTGHIGMMASRAAARQVWTPFMRWLERHA